MGLIECIPNVSEGRNDAIIAELGSIIKQAPKVKLLHVDSNQSANRTVFSIAGENDYLEEAIWNFVIRASELIDMSVHRGSHPRIGAVDVCPFVPLGETTMEQCVSMARSLASRFAEELKTPVFCYSEACFCEEHRPLELIRVGEYEGLEQRLLLKQLVPDFGPIELNKKFGALVIGARWPLIAYNVNLDTTDVAVAKIIASKIRERNNGLPSVKAIGWLIEEFGCVQISMNLVNYNVTGLKAAYNRCAELARAVGVRVTGSEIVGLVPLEALNAVAYELGFQPGLPTSELIAAAVDFLKLDSLQAFVPEQKILEFLI